ncbi:MAG: glycosyltransferase family 2 protein [Desulfobacterales bacterium]|nr:glycosyltransferase family 2 protein [Desulfobacterales bacterium]
MKISVIVTTYNRPQVLKEVLKSLKKQTIYPFEVIVADDGSEPETAQVVNDLSRICPFKIAHVWQEDIGFRAAMIRNKAIKKSKGDYIVCLDGDCIPELHFIEDHTALAQQGFFFQGKRVMVGKQASEYFTHEYAKMSAKLMRIILKGGFSNWYHVFRLPKFPAYSSLSLSGIRSCNMAFFRESIYGVNGFNQDFVGWGREDSELAVRFYGFGLKRKIHPFMAVCFHMWHEEYSRERLNINNELLRKAIESKKYFCSNGLR